MDRKLIPGFDLIQKVIILNNKSLTRTEVLDNQRQLNDALNGGWSVALIKDIPNVGTYFILEKWGEEE